MFEAMWSKNVRSDFFQILNTVFIPTNKIYVLNFQKKMNYGKILAYLFCIAIQNR